MFFLKPVSNTFVSSNTFLQTSICIFATPFSNYQILLILRHKLLAPFKVPTPSLKKKSEELKKTWSTTIIFYVFIKLVFQKLEEQDLFSIKISFPSLLQFLLAFIYSSLNLDATGVYLFIACYI